MSKEDEQSSTTSGNEGYLLKSHEHVVGDDYGFESHLFAASILPEVVIVEAVGAWVTIRGKLCD